MLAIRIGIYLFSLRYLRVSEKYASEPESTMSQEEEKEEAEIIPSRAARGRDHFQSGWRTECTTHTGGLRLSLVKGTLTHTRQYVHHSC